MHSSKHSNRNNVDSANNVSRYVNDMSIQHYEFKYSNNNNESSAICQFSTTNVTILIIKNVRSAI